MPWKHERVYINNNIRTLENKIILFLCISLRARLLHLAVEQVVSIIAARRSNGVAVTQLIFLVLLSLVCVNFLLRERDVDARAVVSVIRHIQIAQFRGSFQTFLSTYSRPWPGLPSIISRSILGICVHQQNQSCIALEKLALLPTLLDSRENCSL